MPTVHEIRYANFMHLYDEFVRQHPGLPHRGMLKLFADRVGISDRLLSHYKCGRKPLGSYAARTLELHTGKPHGWMDERRDPGMEPPSPLPLRSTIEAGYPVTDLVARIREDMTQLLRNDPFLARELVVELLQSMPDPRRPG